MIGLQDPITYPFQMKCKLWYMLHRVEKLMSNGRCGNVIIEEVSQKISKGDIKMNNEY